MSAYRDENQQNSPDTAKAQKQPRPLYEPYEPKHLTHEERVEKRLGWIVAGVWIVAAAVLANFIASLVIGAAAATPSLY
jgi:hypothetical protein